jgi:hypothetical protein
MPSTRRQRINESDSSTDTMAPSARKSRIPTWFILETMAAVMTIGSMLLDLRHKSRQVRKARLAQAASEEKK